MIVSNVIPVYASGKQAEIKVGQPPHDFFTHFAIDTALIDGMVEERENIVSKNGSDECVTE